MVCLVEYICPYCCNVTLVLPSRHEEFRHREYERSVTSHSFLPALLCSRQQHVFIVQQRPLSDFLREVHVWFTQRMMHSCQAHWQNRLMSHYMHGSTIIVGLDHAPFTSTEQSIEVTMLLGSSVRSCSLLLGS